MPLRILFFGTPAFAVPTLAALLDSTHHVVGVVTQPDRARGRGQQVRPEAVKVAALARQIPIFQPERLSDEAFVRTVTTLAPDLGVVAAYGKLLPARLLALPRLGMINVHASVLPRWRGAAPVHRAILAGDQATGVTIMRVVQALDAGPMIATQAVDIDPNETSELLEQRLAQVGAALLGQTVDAIAAGPVGETPQDDRLATYAPKLDRAESAIQWARPAVEIHNQIRGLQPWPLATSELDGRRILFRRAEVDHDRDAGAPPGTLVSVMADSFSVATAPGAVRILRLQEAGGAPMDVRAWLQGRGKMTSGVVLRFL